MPFEQVTPLPVPPVRLHRYSWPDRGFTFNDALDVSWATGNGQAALTIWSSAGGAAGQGNMQPRYGLPGALKSLNMDSAFNGAGSFFNFPVVIGPTQAFTPLDGLGVSVWRTFWSVPLLPDVEAVATFGIGLIGVSNLAPALGARPLIFLGVSPAGLLRVMVQSLVGVVTILGDITAFFPGVDLLMRTEFWLFARNGAVPARCEIYMGGQLAFTIPETDIITQVPAPSFSFFTYLPIVAAGRAPQTVGQIWHGQCDWFTSLQDRSGAILPG